MRHEKRTRSDTGPFMSQHIMDDECLCIVTLGGTQSCKSHGFNSLKCALNAGLMSQKLTQFRSFFELETE